MSKKDSYETLCRVCAADDLIESSIEYLYDNLRGIIDCNDIVLICLPHDNPPDLGTLVGRAAQKVGASCVFWDKDKRWNSLLHLAFLSKATMIVGTPLILLGIAKLAFHEHIPLNISDAICVGYPSTDWMIDAIEQKLDCHAYGILGPGIGPVVTGFSCGCFRGVHLRTECFQFQLVDEHSTPLEDDCKGMLLIRALSDSNVSHVLSGVGKIIDGKCSCGRQSPRFCDIEPNLELHSIDKIMENLQLWSSILDCDVAKGDNGLEIEIVSFPGERLPPIPDCSRLILRHWKPDQDIPLSLKYFDIFGEIL